MYQTLIDTEQQRQALARSLTAHFRVVFRRGEPRTDNVGDLYIQCVADCVEEDDAEDVTTASAPDEPFGGADGACDDLSTGDGFWEDPWASDPQESRGTRTTKVLLVELQSMVDPPRGAAEGHGSLEPAFDVQQQEALGRLGLLPPRDGMPNWWLIGDPDDFPTMARALIDALVDVAGIPLDVVDADLWTPRRRSREKPLVFNCSLDRIPDGDSEEVDVVADPTGLALDYAAFAMQRREQVMRSWPWTAEVEPAFFAIVDCFGPSDVLALLALAPLGPGDLRVGWLRRTRRGWIHDPTTPRRLARCRSERLRPITSDVARRVERDLRF